MAANTITQITTANTFQHWLTATQSLIGTANLLTNGAGSTFFANTRLEVGGSATSTLNVVTSATINDLIGNTSNITTSNTVSLQARNLNLTENVTSTLKTTGAAFVGTDLTVHGNSLISGDLTVSGNIILDAIGFDDLSVNGSATIANTLSVTGNSTFSNANVTNTLTANIATITTANITTANIVTGNIATANIITGNIATANIISLVGTSNTAIYAAISAVEGAAVALAIALG